MDPNLPDPRRPNNSAPQPNAFESVLDAFELVQEWLSRPESKRPSPIDDDDASIAKPNAEPNRLSAHDRPPSPENAADSGAPDDTQIPANWRDLPSKVIDFFLVCDVLKWTCQSGLGAWIHWRQNDETLVQTTADALDRLGHDQCAHDVRAAWELYASDPEWKQLDRWHALDDHLIDDETKIIDNLYAILTSS